MTLQEFLDWAQKLGVAGGPIFAFLWWLERGERLEAHSELRDITKDSITAITKAENAVKQLISVFNPGRSNT